MRLGPERGLSAPILSMHACVKVLKMTHVIIVIMHAYLECTSARDVPNPVHHARATGRTRWEQSS
jgi:hypothetical protein